MHILIVEDNTQDAIAAADLARELGIMSVNLRSNASAARMLLEDALDGKISLPDVILLDLDLGYESGFELLRFWHHNPKLASCRVVIWTQMDGQREISEMFKAHAVVMKSEGPKALKSVLSELANTS